MRSASIVIKPSAVQHLAPPPAHRPTAVVPLPCASAMTPRVPGSQPGNRRVCVCALKSPVLVRCYNFSLALRLDSNCYNFTSALVVPSSARRGAFVGRVLSPSASSSLSSCVQGCAIKHLKIKVCHPVLRRNEIIFCFAALLRSRSLSFVSESKFLAYFLLKCPVIQVSR